MNATMLISHRLFASALGGGGAGRKSRAATGRGSVIEVEPAEGTRWRAVGRGAPGQRGAIVAWATAQRQG